MTALAIVARWLDCWTLPRIGRRGTGPVCEHLEQVVRVPMTDSARTTPSTSATVDRLGPSPTDGLVKLPPGAVVLTRAQAVEVVVALIDAAAYRRDLADQPCQGCDTHPAGLCDTCSGHLDRADDYDALAASLDTNEPVGEEPIPNGSAEEEATTR